MSGGPVAPDGTGGWRLGTCPNCGGTAGPAYRGGYPFCVPCGIWLPVVERGIVPPETGPTFEGDLEAPDWSLQQQFGVRFCCRCHRYRPLADLERRVVRVVPAAQPKPRMSLGLLDTLDEIDLGDLAEPEQPGRGVLLPSMVSGPERFREDGVWYLCRQACKK